MITVQRVEKLRGNNWKQVGEDSESIRRKFGGLPDSTQRAFFEYLKNIRRGIYTSRFRPNCFVNDLRLAITVYVRLNGRHC